jgi:hypothetical protein
MTDLTVNFIFLGLGALCIVGIVSVAAPLFLKSSSEKPVKELTRKVQAFLSAEAGNNSGGRYFAELIDDGFLLSLVMGNHSGFDDGKQLEDFRRQSESEIVVSAMKKVGETYDRYYI